MKFPVDLIFGFVNNRGDFFRDTLTIVTGSVFSRLNAILLLPVLSRIFTPEEFGALALFTLIVVTVACIASGGYESAIVLPDNDSDALHLALIAMAFALISSLLSAGALGLWGPEILAAFSADSLQKWLWLIPAYIFVVSAASVVSFWATRKKLFGHISAGEVTGTSIKISSQIGLQLAYSLGSGSLILGQFTYQLSSITILLYGALRDPLTTIGDSFSIKRALNLMGRYKKFPQYETWGNLLGVSSREFPVLILSWFFPLGVVGLYSISHRIMSMPPFVIGLSIMRVFYPMAKEAHAAGNLDEITRKLVKQMLVLSVTPALLFLIAAPEVVEVVLGKAWGGAGIYIQWLTVFILTHFLILPLIELFLVCEKQKEKLNYQVILSALRLGGLIAGGFLVSPVIAVALASSVGAVVNFVTIIVLLLYAGIRVGESINLIVVEVLKALPFVAALALLKYIYPDQVLVVLMFLAAGLLFCIIRLRSLLAIKSQVA
jgi:lipopolysaccharide exporter